MAMLPDPSDEVASIPLRSYLERYYSLAQRTEAFKERRFHSLEIELTNSCNQECLYCYNWSTRRSVTPVAATGDISRWLRDAHASGIREVFWLGGEPLTYLDLESVLEDAAALGIQSTLLTNGTLLTPQRWAKLKPFVRRLVFHLDTIDESAFCTINNVTTAQGRRLLRSAISNLEHIRGERNRDLDVILYMVLLQPMLATLRPTLEWAIDGGLADTTALYPMVTAGRARRAPSTWTPTAADLRAAFELRAAVEGRPELLRLGPSEYCKHYQLTMAYLDIDGYLSPYAGITSPRFSTAGRSLSELLAANYDELSFSSLGRPDPARGVAAPCGTCNFNDLCFGTRTSAFNHLGATSARDPFCWVGEQ